MMKIYLADYKYNQANITEFEVEEKDKTYKVVSKKDIVGWRWANRTIKKDDSRICNSLYDAFLKIDADAKDKLDVLYENYKEAEASYKIIKEVSDVIRKDPSRLDKALAELM